MRYEKALEITAMNACLFQPVFLATVLMSPSGATDPQDPIHVVIAHGPGRVLPGATPMRGVQAPKEVKDEEFDTPPELTDKAQEPSAGTKETLRKLRERHRSRK